MKTEEMINVLSEIQEMCEEHEQDGRCKGCIFGYKNEFFKAAVCGLFGYPNNWDIGMIRRENDAE